MLLQWYCHLVKASAIYDLVVTAPFATPWSFALVHKLLGTLSPLPAFEPLHVFFANLLGSIVIVWSVLRIWRPEPIFGLFDFFGRILFFAWQIYYLVAYDVTPVLWAFAAFGFFWGGRSALWLLVAAQGAIRSAVTMLRGSIFFRANALLMFQPTLGRNRTDFS